jgi:hypothetical protein
MIKYNIFATNIQNNYQAAIHAQRTGDIGFRGNQQKFRLHIWK